MAPKKDDAKAGASQGAPVLPCPHCGRPLDDIETMDEPQLLATIHLGLLRDLARSVRGGEASHQELAIARGLLRDNKKLVPVEKDEDGIPEGKLQLPKREFKEYGHDE